MFVWIRPVNYCYAHRDSRLPMRTWRFITILFTALSMAMAFCHLLEMPTRMSFDGRLWITTQALYRLFGPPLGAIIEGGAVITTVILAFLVRQRRPAFWWTLTGAACIIMAHVIWWIFINPVNAEISTWTPDTVPADWMRYRSQWEYTHAARAVLQIIGLSALVLSVLLEIPRDHSRDRTMVSIRPSDSTASATLRTGWRNGLKHHRQNPL
jgi:hypothetical protein